MILNRVSKKKHKLQASFELNFYFRDGLICISFFCSDWRLVFGAYKWSLSFRMTSSKLRRQCLNLILKLQNKKGSKAQKRFLETWSGGWVPTECRMGQYRNDHNREDKTGFLSKLAWNYCVRKNSKKLPFISRGLLEWWLCRLKFKESVKMFPTKTVSNIRHQHQSGRCMVFIE